MIATPDSLRGIPANLNIEMLDPAQVLVDAPTYQFRKNGDACGVTRSGVYNTDHWDPLLHGNPILVHQRLDGRVFVADGHHRLDLAKRSNAVGQGPGKVSAFVLRESDGYTPEDVRVIAAYRNMAKGRFQPLEGARVFQEVRSGKVHLNLLPSLQMNTDKLRLSYTLSGLSNDELNRMESYVTQQVPGDEERQNRIFSIIGDELQKQSYDVAPVVNRGCSVCMENSSPGHVNRLMQQRAASASTGYSIN